MVLRSLYSLGAASLPLLRGSRDTPFIMIPWIGDREFAFRRGSFTGRERYFYRRWSGNDHRGMMSSPYKCNRTICRRQGAGIPGGDPDRETDRWLVGDRAGRGPTELTARCGGE